MAIRIELTVRLQNSPGSLDKVCRALADEQVNLLAMALEGGGVLRLVVDNHVHAGGVLREQHYKVDERDVLYTLVPNEPGALSRMTRLIAEAGINLDYAYATAVEQNPMVGIVLGVPDAQRASAFSGI